MAPSQARHARSLSLLCLGLCAGACSSRDATMPEEWTVQVAASAPPAVRLAADDVASYLILMGQRASVVTHTGVSRCAAGVGVVAFAGDGVESAHDDPEALFDAAQDGGVPAALVGTARDPGDRKDPITRAAQRLRITETRCGDGVLGVHVTLSGGGLFGRQFAAYDWLHVLGVRFFHPEEEYVPARPRWPASPLRKDHTPPFQFRSVSLHLTHPLELGDPIRAGRSELLGEAKRYIDWQVKNLATNGLGGAGPAGGPLAEYGILRGFPRGTGFNLHETQQGGRPLIDPDSTVPVNEQIGHAIDERLTVSDPSRKPRFFSFLFNPSEFTELPDLQIVSEMTFISDYLREHHPEVILSTINHGTHGAPTEHYGVRYYDLPQFAPPNLGVSVHTLMFYDLFRPAPIYGNESFRFLYDFMVREHRTRRLWYFPEAAWWLTFDVAVPLYLPITIEARDRDLQAISFMLDGQLVGHHVFGTGHEWGYWQNEYCSLRMSADLSYRWRDCLADIVSGLGAAATETQAVLERAVELQERDIIYGDILAYLVGTDPETELAAQVGVVFHPLPPSPAQVARWELSAVDDFERRVSPTLSRMELDHTALVARLEAVASAVPAAGRPFFDEIRDGLAMNGLRARHGRLVYGSMVAARAAKLRFDATLLEVAQTRLRAATQTTEEALRVVARREAGYRYQPLSRSTAGGPNGTEDTNWTVYTYRYLNRTHHGYYYTRIDQLAAQALLGGDEPLRADDALFTADTPLSLTVAPGLDGPTVAFGDGQSGSGTQLTHSYAQPGIYELTLRAQKAGAPVVVTASVAALQDRTKTGFSGRILEPAGAAIIQGIFPGLVLGRIDATTAALGFAVDPASKIALDRWVRLPTRADGAALETLPTRLVVPVVNHSSGAILTSVVVENAVVSAPAERGSLTLRGELATQAVVDALVAIGGFEAVGARALVASTLGFTPDTLPATVPLRVAYEVR